ncbi:hypothetical protein KM043_004742 [Ampulex compressa]|nr:hypothetical protein KM043_004742 [Ampulex compressa]
MNASSATSMIAGAQNVSQNDSAAAAAAAGSAIPNCEPDLPIVSLMQTVTNMYIVNLAIADECFLIGIPFLVTTMSLRSWIFGKIMCKVYMTTTSINQFTSSIFLFIMSADRKLQTVGPKNKSKEKKRSHRKVTKLVLTVITVYVLCWLPYWLTQVALIYTPPKQCQTSIGITSFLLAGFLSYSNSAMNPILYAFLSDNFKKSFLKACTCAAGKDVNATLHIENSVFPRRNRANAERLQSANRLVVTSAGQSKHEFEEEEDAERGLLISKTSTTTVTMTSRSNITLSGEPRDQSRDRLRSKDPLKNGAQLTLLTQV